MTTTRALALGLKTLIAVLTLTGTYCLGEFRGARAVADASAHVYDAHLKHARNSAASAAALLVRDVANDAWSQTAGARLQAAWTNRARS